eukprot:scaffold201822_cov17-Tisochrysis_lutea.AAC.1
MMPSLLWRLEGMVCAHELRERLRSTLVHGSAAGKGLKRNDEGSVGNDSAAACAKQESTQESEEQQQQQLQQPQAEEKGKGVDSQDVLQVGDTALQSEGLPQHLWQCFIDITLVFFVTVEIYNSHLGRKEEPTSECPPTHSKLA